MENQPEPDKRTLEPEGLPASQPWHIVEAIEPDEDVLSRLTAEDEAGQPAPPKPPRSSPAPARLGQVLLAVLAFAAVAGGAGLAWYFYGPARSPAVANGTLFIETRPAGALVTIDGKVQGAAPLTVSLLPGRHIVELAGTAKRELTVSIDPGARVSQYVEMPDGQPGGRLLVETNPPGAQVAIDGSARGLTPLDVEGLQAGPHAVTLRSGSATVTQNVTVEDGVRLVLFVPLGATETARTGSVAVACPVELQVYEGQRLLGTSRLGPIALAAGRHDLRLANSDVGFETTRTVQVTPGRPTEVTIDLPNGALFVNAVPWAEVFVDGSKIGETPIANHPLRLGPHEIVLRNPRFAEQRRTVVISLAAPVRIGVDLRQ